MRPEWVGEAGEGRGEEHSRQRELQVGALRGQGLGSGREGPGQASEAVEGDLRPYPESNAKLLRGFTRADLRR